MTYVDALDIISKSERVDTEVAVEANSLLGQINRSKFKFMVSIIVEILTIFKPANNMMQGEKCNAADTVNLVKSAVADVQALRNDDKFHRFAAAAGFEEVVKEKRVRKQSKLKDSFVMSTLGQTDLLDNCGKESTAKELIKKVYFEIIDNVVGEIQNRFAEINSSYIICIMAMLPSSKDFLKDSY